tara:strand:- start:2692 stop:3246 length:555 start_codon:yes stop_codon:yes gene_type:complete
MGQCFTAVGEEPSSGKEALIQRTVCLMARKETDVASPDSQFKETIKQPGPMAAVRDFKLFTCLVGYVRMAIMGLDWLQPDFAFANVVFIEADRIVEKEYGMTKPEPRRLQKRAENLKTMCVMEAVARVYFFKQVTRWPPSNPPLPSLCSPHHHLPSRRLRCSTRRASRTGWAGARGLISATCGT